MPGDTAPAVAGVDTQPQHQSPEFKAECLVTCSVYHASRASVCASPCALPVHLSSAYHRHPDPDPEHQPWPYSSLLSHSLRPRKENTWQQAEIRSRARGSCQAMQHPRHVVVRICLNGVSFVLVNRRLKM